MSTRPVFQGVDATFSVSRSSFQDFDPPISVFGIPLTEGGISAGASLARIDDVDGDGVPDLAVGAPAFVLRQPPQTFSPGAVLILSGATLETLRVIDRLGFPNDLGAPTSVGDLLGSAIGGASGAIGGTVISLGDVDGDGRDDLLLGNPFDDVLVPDGGLALDRGRYWVVFGRAPGEEGDPLLQAVDITGQRFPPNYTFGVQTANLGDLNGDGVADFAITSSSNVNIVDVFSGATQEVLYSIQGPAAGPPRQSWIGEAITPLGDINGDGISDFALGDERGVNPNLPPAIGPTLPGAVSLHSGADGSVIRVIYVNTSDAREFGDFIVNMGDVNLDGVTDIAVGAPSSSVRSEDIAQAGGIAIFSGADGALLAFRRGSRDGEYLGRDIAAAGDLDGDGVTDLLAPSFGSLRVLSGVDLRDIGRVLPPPGAVNLGASMVSMGDLDGDGFPEIAVGAPGDGALAGVRDGGVHILSVRPLARFAETPTYDFAGDPVRLNQTVEIINPQANTPPLRPGNYFHDDVSVTVERAGGANPGDMFGFDFTGRANGLRLAEDGNSILGLSNSAGPPFVTATLALFSAADGRLSITFANSADPLGVQDAQLRDILRSITYRNTEAAPPDSLDLVWTIQGSDGATTRLQTVLITGAPDPVDPEEPAPLPTLSVAAPLAVVEGTAALDDPDDAPGRITFTLTLSEAAAVDIAVAYDLLAGGDGAGFVAAEDLLSPATGTLTLVAGATTASLVVLMNPDALAEPDERLAPALTATTLEATPRAIAIGPVPQVLVEDDDAPGGGNPGGGDPGGGGGPGTGDPGGGPGGGGPGDGGDLGDDDDELEEPAAITLTLSGPERLLEGDSGETLATFTLALTEAGPAPVRVGWTVAGSAGPSDLAPGTAFSGSVLLAPGEVSTELTVRILGDRLVERDETLVLAIAEVEANGSLPLGPLPAAVTTTLANDDAATLSVTGGSVVEGNAGARLLPFTFTLTAAVDVPVAVGWSVQAGGLPGLADAADFVAGQPLSGTTVLQAGQTSATLLVAVRGDNVVEPDERVRLLLDGIEAYGRDVTAAADVADGLLVNDDALEVALLSPDRRVTEGEGAAGITFELGLLRPGPDGGPMVALDDITIDWQVIPGAPGLGAVGADDFAPDTALSGTVTLPAGQSAASVTLALNDDTIAERPEGFSLVLTGAGFAGGPRLALGDIQARVAVEDDDAAVVAVRASATAVLEGTGAADQRSVEYVFTRTGDTSREVTVDWAVDVITGPAVLVPDRRIETKTDPVTGFTQEVEVIFFRRVTEAETFSNEPGERAQLERTVPLSFVRREENPSESFGVPAPEPEYEIFRLPEWLRDFDVSVSNPLVDVDLFAQLDGGLYLVLDNPSAGVFEIGVSGRGGVVMPNYVLPGEIFLIRPEASLGDLSVSANVAGPGFDGIALEGRIAVTGPTGIGNIVLRDPTGEEVLRFEDELLVPLTNGDGSPLTIRFAEITKAEEGEDGASFSVNDIAKQLGAEGVENLPAINVVANVPSEVVTNLSGGAVLDRTSTPVTVLALRTDGIEWLGYVNPIFDLASIEYSLEDLVAKSNEGNKDPDRFDLTKVGSAEASLKLVSWELDAGIGLVMDVFYKPDPVVVEVDFAGTSGSNIAGTPFSFTAPDAPGTVLDGQVRWIQRGDLEITWRLSPTGTQRWEGPTLSLEAEFSEAIQAGFQALGIEPPALDYEVDWLSGSEFEDLQIVDTAALDAALYAFTVQVEDYELSRVERNISVPVLDPFNTPLAGRLTFAPGETELAVRLPILPDAETEPGVTARMRILDAASDDGAVVNVAQPNAETRIVDDDGQSFPWWALQGDPHLETLDGLAYDFHAPGEFVLARATDGTEFALQARFEPLEGSDLVTVTTAVAVLVEGRRVTFGLDTPGFAAVDGTPVALAPSEVITLGDGSLTFDGTTWFVATAANDLLAVRGFSDFLDLGFAPAAARAGGLEGLLGDFDGDPLNDLALADGNPIGGTPAFSLLYGDFADAWRVGAADTLFDYAPGEGPGSFVLPGLPRGVLTLDALPADLVAAAAALLDGFGVTDPVRRDNAILDLVLTGDLDYAESALGLQAATRGAAPVKLVPADAPPLGALAGVQALQAEATEAGAAEFGLGFAIWRAGDLSAEGVVHWTLQGGAELAPSQPLAGTVTFAAGQARSVVLVALQDDDVAEADAAITLRIASDDFLIAGPAARSLVLDDDAPAPTLAAGPRRGGPGNDVLVGGPGADWLSGLGGDDTLLGLGGDDRLEGGPGDDTLEGGEGNDRLVGGAGADSLRGGPGVDVAVHGGATGVVVNLALGLGSGGDMLAEIENLSGTAGDDILTGDDAANRLVGGAGDDRLDGGAGSDRLQGGPGADHLIGGAGQDTAVFGGLEGVQVDLTLGIGQGGDAEGDRLSGIENLLGTQADDVLMGDAAANRLLGNAGNDTLVGGGGGDTLIGGAGDDLLVFRFGDAPGRTRVFGFGQEGDDAVRLEGFADFATFTDVEAALREMGADVWLHLDDDSSIAFLATRRADITAADFLFQ